MRRVKNIAPGLERQEGFTDFDVDFLEPGGPLFPPPKGTVLNQEHVNGDPYKGPFEIKYLQKAAEKKCIFYLTSYWWKWDDRKKNGFTSIPVFWAAGEGRKSGTIPGTLTMPNTDKEQPEELKKYWPECVIKVGYATCKEKDKVAHQFLVVLPDDMDIYQKRFLEHVEASKVLTYFKKAATEGVTTAAKTVSEYAAAAASAGIIAGGVGVAVIGTGGVALAAVPVGMAVGFVVKSAVSKLDGVIGDALIKVFGNQGKTQSVNIDGYLYDDDTRGETPPHYYVRDDRSATTKERIEDLEDTMGEMVTVLSHIEESMAQHMIRTRTRKRNFEAKMNASRPQYGARSGSSEKTRITRNDKTGEYNFWS